jgi:hypothetical protein
MVWLAFWWCFPIMAHAFLVHTGFEREINEARDNGHRSAAPTSGTK